MFKGLILGIFTAALLLVLAGYAFLKFYPLPVAVADKPFPFERQLVHVPLGARINKEAPAVAPFAISEDVFEGGATTYKQQCASCHGIPGADSSFGQYMYPSAPQLWKKHKRGGVVGVSDDPAGETYWKVANGIRLTGMPAFNKVLTPIQMWQVSLLLANADKPIPDPVMSILKKQDTATQ